MTFERLYTPWRMNYITSSEKKEGCVFCNALNEAVEADRENYVLYRGPEIFAIMNLYPYNTGHIMILPNQHVSTLAEISAETQVEIILLTTYFTELLTDLMKPEGFNVGINIGSAAGAGIASHLHVHVVPRWTGDSNFMTVVNQTRVLPETVDATYEKILSKIQENPPTLSADRSQ